MNSRKASLVVITTIIALCIASAGHTFAAPGGLSITYNSQTQLPSFISGDIHSGNAGASASAQTVANATLAANADLLGLAHPAQEFNVAETTTDALGMTHVRYQQVYKGVSVLGGYVNVHLGLDGQSVEAITSGYVPGVALDNTSPAISAQQALATAQQAMPSGNVLKAPQLVVYTTVAAAGAGLKSTVTTSKLAWVLELVSDLIPSRNRYIIDAQDGSIIDVFELLTNSRNRKTYTANNTQSLPGTLKRSEADGLVNDKDVDNAHAFAGLTYDYFFNNYQRDSYNKAGAALVSTAHYGNNYKNAFWNGKQMVYGDNFPTKDVAAHELSHAVTEYSVPGGLDYSWQSGALNESISDIFGAMVDRDDWLIGEDLPSSVLGGREAIRDMANPKRFGQPDQAKDWVQTCSDNEGVHTNSGIPNKAYYNIATSLGKDKAERIFYRALTTYFRSQSSMEDARAAALQAAADLYGSASAEYTGVRNGFNAVGLDGTWNPPANSCTCTVNTSLSSASIFGNATDPLNIATTIYRFRDELMGNSAAGVYYRNLYEQHTGRASLLIALNPALLNQTAGVLKDATIGLGSLVNGTSDQVVVTLEMVDESVSLLKNMAADDRAKGGGNLAKAIESELARVDTPKMVGMTYAQAWDYLNSAVNLARFKVFVPVASQ